MTLQDFTDKLKTYALNHKFVGQFKEGDVFEIMNAGEQEYASVILTINSIRTDLKQTTVNCYIYYIDRLLEDNSNRLEIWAVGTDTLQKIIYMAGYNNFEIVAGQNVTYQPFREKFQDLCAGVYANLDFTFVNDVNQCISEIY